MDHSSRWVIWEPKVKSLFPGPPGMAVEGEAITEPAKPLNMVSLGPGGPPSSTLAWKPSPGCA